MVYQNFRIVCNPMQPQCKWDVKMHVARNNFGGQLDVSSLKFEIHSKLLFRIRTEYSIVLFCIFAVRRFRVSLQEKYTFQMNEQQ